MNNELHSWSFDNKQTHYDMPERLCSFGLTDNPEEFICAFESGFALYNIADGQIEWLEKIEPADANTRLNDGRVDRQGRFWAGSMTETSRGSGHLYRLQQGEVTCMLSDVLISNSLCWSPDNQHMYFADSPKQQIWRFPFDSESGQPGTREPFAETGQNAFPDGSCVDAAGNVWNAQWGASQVVCYAPDGNVLFTLDVPCTQPSCVAFAGSELNYLVVTSATQGMPPEQISSNPAQGNVFIYHTNCTGLPEAVYVR